MGSSAALVGSFVYAAINTVLTSILGVDRDGSFFGLLISSLHAKRHGRRRRTSRAWSSSRSTAWPTRSSPRRVRAGSVNTIGSWIRDGSHKLSRWEAMLPSMTSASQAGILHGTNDGIPAFRWYERDRQKLMVSSNPDDAAEIVRRLSNGEGLLSNDGVSICNLMTGDATRAYVTTGAIKDESQGLGDSQAFLGFFFSPSGYLRSFSMFVGEFVKERFQARRTRRSGISPADAPGHEVRRHARRQQRPAARHEHLADHRGDVPRRERHLLRLHRLRRAGPPLRARAGRVVPGARRRRRRDRQPPARRPRTRRGRTGS